GGRLGWGLRRQEPFNTTPPPLYVLFFKKDENRLRAVELVGKGVRGGQREALSTASAVKVKPT
ncbi:MAG: hypothetical protein ACRD9S_24895, partial [Pyrinomonadaceae bacterium]